MNMDSDTVWRALASPHRRAILDDLREGPKTTGELNRTMPELSRFAVMQHLKVLEECKLVLYRREGRRRLNYSNPAPVQEIYERWVSGYASGAAKTALQFKRYAESKQEVEDLNNFRSVQIETEISVKATAQTCFDALTRNYNNWFPHRFKPDSVVYSEATLGGTNGERFADGGGAIHSTVVYVDEPIAITYGGPGTMLDGCNIYSAYKLEENEGNTTVKRRMHLWGDVSEDFENVLRSGTNQLFESSFRKYVEDGIRFKGGSA
jgi:DNA-binding transcriptional ArsR family regulator